MKIHGIFSGAIFLTLSYIIFMASGYVINIWLGHLLGPANYGLYGVIISLMTLVNLIQSSGLPQATSKFVSAGEDEPAAVLKSSLVIQLVATIIVTLLFIAFAPVLAKGFHDPSLTPYIRLSAIILPLYSLFSIYSGYFNGLHNFRSQAGMTIAYSIVKAVLVMSLVYYIGLKGAILGFILAPLIVLLFVFHWPRSDHSFPYKKLISFSAPLIAFSVIAILPLYLDLFFLKSMLRDNYLTGLYNAAGNVADIPFYALGAFAIVLFPSISRLTSQNNLAEAKLTIENALRVVLIILVPAVAILSAGSREVLRLIYSKSYVDASPALSILAIGIGFLTLFTILANILNGSGRSKLSVIFASIGIAIIAGSCFLLIPRYGIQGAAMATSLGCFVAFLFSYRFVHKFFGASFAWRSIVKVVALSALIYILVATISVPLVILPIFYLILFTAYLVALYFIGEITKQDLALAKSLLPGWVPYTSHD